MDNFTALRVHVAPVGLEVDRIVIPVKEKRADRVWLLVQSGDVDSGEYLKTIHTRLEGSGVDVRDKLHDRTDLFDIVRATREVIRQEQNHNIFVNISSGSKMQAIGCMMACMMFNAKSNVHSYYAEPAKYHLQDEPLSTGVRKVFEMPQYNLQVPSELLARALQIIRHSRRIRKRDLLNSLLDAGIMKIATDSGPVPKNGALVVNALEENRLVAGLARMEKSIIHPLSEWGFVEISRVGRSRWVFLTEAGEHAAKFLSDEPAS